MEILALAVICALIVWLQNTLYRHYAFQKLRYRCYLSKEQVFEGEEIELIEEIENRKWLPLPWFKTEITASRYLDFAGSQSLVADKRRFVPSFFMLKSFQRVSRRWKVRCLKRGEYSIEQVVLVTSDLLGNVSLSQGAALGENTRILVLPRPLDAAELAVSPRCMTGDIIVRRSLLEDPFSIAGVREYTELEPMNHIHWTATAREQKLMVYQNDSTSRQNVTVLLNLQSREFEQFAAIDAEILECAIRVCAGLFDQTLTSGMPLRFLTNAAVDDSRTTICTNEYWGAEYVESLFQLLARLQLRSTEDFTVFLSDLYHTITSTDIVIVTAYLNERILDFSRRKQWDGVRVRVLLLGEILPALDASDCEIWELNPLVLQKEASA